MWTRLSVLAVTCAVALASAVTAWIAFPTEVHSELPGPLVEWAANGAASPTGPYTSDFAALASGFRPQTYRSFCGPATIATVLRAYGVATADQRAIFPSVMFKLDAFYSGVSLAQLAMLARRVGLQSELVYANTLSLDQFRERLKINLSHDGDFVVINYDRRILQQSGAGHISAVGAYDAVRDAFLVLDEAAYRYPFTWVPATLLYQAVHTRADDGFRGVLFVQSYRPPLS